MPNRRMFSGATADHQHAPPGRAPLPPQPKPVLRPPPVPALPPPPPPLPPPPAVSKQRCPPAPKKELQHYQKLLRNAGLEASVSAVRKHMWREAATREARRARAEARAGLMALQRWGGHVNYQEVQHDEVQELHASLEKVMQGMRRCLEGAADESWITRTAVHQALQFSGTNTTAAAVQDAWTSYLLELKTRMPQSLALEVLIPGTLPTPSACRLRQHLNSLTSSSRLPYDRVEHEVTAFLAANGYRPPRKNGLPPQSELPSFRSVLDIVPGEPSWLSGNPNHATGGGEEEEEEEKKEEGEHCFDYLLSARPSPDPIGYPEEVACGFMKLEDIPRYSDFDNAAWRMEVCGDCAPDGHHAQHPPFLPGFERPRLGNLLKYEVGLQGLAGSKGAKLQCPLANEAFCCSLLRDKLSRKKLQITLDAKTLEPHAYVTRREKASQCLRAAGLLLRSAAAVAAEPGTAEQSAAASLEEALHVLVQEREPGDSALEEDLTSFSRVPYDVVMLHLRVGNRSRAVRFLWHFAHTEVATRPPVRSTVLLSPVDRGNLLIFLLQMLRGRFPRTAVECPISGLPFTPDEDVDQKPLLTNAAAVYSAWCDLADKCLKGAPHLEEMRTGVPRGVVRYALVEEAAGIVKDCGVEAWRKADNLLLEGVTTWSGRRANVEELVALVSNRVALRIAAKQPLTDTFCGLLQAGNLTAGHTASCIALAAVSSFPSCSPLLFPDGWRAGAKSLVAAAPALNFLSLYRSLLEGTANHTDTVIALLDLLPATPYRSSVATTYT